MKLYGSPTSPYVRKARVLILEKKVPCEWVTEDPWAEDSPIAQRNPLGKVPALEIEPNNYLFESVLIVHYLDHVDGKSLTPKDAGGYWQAQWWQALAQGILDAAVARVLESRRPAEKLSAPSHCIGVAGRRAAARHVVRQRGEQATRIPEDHEPVAGDRERAGVRGKRRPVRPGEAEFDFRTARVENPQ